ncbi:hypothetical protein ACTFIZ_007931 [Dictyostelium cf. discoideum]
MSTTVNNNEASSSSTSASNNAESLDLRIKSMEDQINNLSLVFTRFMKEPMFSSNTASRSQPSHDNSDTESEQSDNETSNDVDVPTEYQLSDTLLGSIQAYEECILKKEEISEMNKVFNFPSNFSVNVAPFGTPDGISVSSNVKNNDTDLFIVEKRINDSLKPLLLMSNTYAESAIVLAVNAQASLSRVRRNNIAKEIYGSEVLLPIKIKDTPKMFDGTETERVRKLAKSIRKNNEAKQSLLKMNNHSKSNFKKSVNSSGNYTNGNSSNNSKSSSGSNGRSNNFNGSATCHQIVEKWWSDTRTISSVRTTLETKPQEESQLDWRAYSRILKCKSRPATMLVLITLTLAHKTASLIRVSRQVTPILITTNKLELNQPCHDNSDTESEQSGDETSNDVDVPIEYQLSNTLLGQYKHMVNNQGLFVEEECILKKEEVVNVLKVHLLPTFKPMPNPIPISIPEGPKSDCITKEVQDLLADNAIEQVLPNRYSKRVFFSNVFTVPKPGTTLHRPVKHLHKQPIIQD